MNGYQSDFVIITALVKPEFEQFKRAVRDLSGTMKELRDSPGVYAGSIGRGPHRFRFYAASQLSPGMVSSAVLATKMIERYRPKYLVMLGIAAGFPGRNVRPASVLIATFVTDYQKGKIDAKGFHPEGEGIPLDMELKGKFNRTKDEILAEMNRELDVSTKPIDARLGPIATGSQVVASQDIMEGIRNTLRKAVGVEMEGFAIFHAAAEAEIPRPIPMLIKSVADFAVNKNDKHQRDASLTSAYFFLKFALRNLQPLGLPASLHTGLELMPWKFQDEREKTRLNQMLGKARKGSTVKFISITGRQFLAPRKRYLDLKNPDAFDEALEKGVNFSGILLDPRCSEANFRSKIESPKDRLRLLVRDARDVSNKLRGASDAWRSHLQIRYSKVGLGFKLWIFEDVAYIEPYHFGKPKKAPTTDTGLCGFSHLWIQRSEPEYELLDDHFQQLWNRLPKGWPRRETRTRSAVGKTRRTVRGITRRK
jgi:nucleoside phosphorylase